MEYKFLDATGSFKAWGVCFHYEFEANTNILDIINARENRPIIYVDTEQASTQNVLSYVGFADKVSQLYALNFSDNETIDLTDILNGPRLKAS